MLSSNHLSGPFLIRFVPVGPKDVMDVFLVRPKDDGDSGQLLLQKVDYRTEASG